MLTHLRSTLLSAAPPSKGNHFGDGILHYVIIPLAIPATIVLVAFVVRLARILWFRISQHGFPPLVLRTGNGSESAAFGARLSAYIVQDTLGADIIIPPGGGSAEKSYPIETLENPGWLTAVLRIVLAREPAFDVYIDCVKFQPTNDRADSHEATVRITKSPGSRLLAAASFRGDVDEDLVHDAACLITHSVRQARPVLRHTTRWERWNPEIAGYSEYLRALDYERRGDYASALEKYNDAVRHEPGSFLITTRKAALLEIMGHPQEAADVYRTSKELWPETIETTYRLAAAYANGNSHKLANQTLDEILGRLRLITLYWAWIRTWWPTHWNIGERRYWRSWIRRNPTLFGVSKRVAYLRAVEIAKLARKMEALTRGAQNQSETPVSLLRKVTKWTTKTKAWTVYVRQFHPDAKLTERFNRRHMYSWHQGDTADFDMYPTINVRQKRRIGWLAHYNAAIFFSFAINLKPDELPPGYDIASWQTDCARAAIRELGHVKRDPRNELEPDWYRSDPGLKSLREHMQNFGPRWSEFVGLAASTDDKAPLGSISAADDSIVEPRNPNPVDGDPAIID